MMLMSEGPVFPVARDTRVGYTRPRTRIRKPAETLVFWEVVGESLPLRRRHAGRIGRAIELHCCNISE
jgi:hypothetical protein